MKVAGGKWADVVIMLTIRCSQRGARRVTGGVAAVRRCRPHKQRQLCCGALSESRGAKRRDVAGN